MSAASEVVLVAEELRELAGPAYEWPEGRRTVFFPSSLPEDRPLPAGERAAALIPLVSFPAGERRLAALPRLRVVANYGVGVDNVDLAAAARRGVAVTNTPDVLTGATADLAWALLLAAARRLREGLELAAGGGWEGWHPMQLLGVTLQGRRLGILGAGRIGGEVARRAPPFGLEVGYWSRSAAPELEAETGAHRFLRLEEILAWADFLSVHLPLTPETEGLLGERELGLLKPGAVLVNTARGAIVEPAALAAALRSGRLFAAGVDVYPEEPAVPAGLRELPNAFLLPHLGSATREARRGMWELAAENVRRVLAGGKPLTPVGVAPRPSTAESRGRADPGSGAPGR